MPYIRKHTTHEARSLYDDDLYAWTQAQALALREGRVSDIDLRHLAEEIDDVGSEQYNKLQSALTILLGHILKWEQRPSKRTPSWAATIRTQRRHIERVIGKSLYLKSRLDEAVTEAWEDGRDLAAGETGIPLRKFPVANPYSWNAMMETPFEIDKDDNIH